MILSLKILRGINLLEMDKNLIASNSSHPYCQVYVNGKKKGWTPTQYGTLSPVWGGPMSTFRIEGGGGTKIEIRLFDYHEFSKDDFMGSVTFYIRDLMERAHKDHYPSFWCTVDPPKGYENTPAGRLQIRLLKVDESEKKDSLAKPVTTPHVSLSAGPLVDISNKSLQDHIMSAKTPVMLHVYDVGLSSKVQNINNALPYCGVGGIFHGAIEVYGREYSFGGSRNNVCGIFFGKPASCPLHHYRESIYLGDCRLDRAQVVAVLRRMKPEWMAPTYDMLHKNCCTFSNELAIELGVGGIPGWVMSLANIAAGVNAMMGKERNDAHDVHRLQALRATWRSLETNENHHTLLEDLSLEYIMVVRLQRQFRARQAKKKAGKLLTQSRRKLIQQRIILTARVYVSPSFNTALEMCVGPVQIRRATVNAYDGIGFEATRPQIRRATVNKYAGQGFEVDA